MAMGIYKITCVPTGKCYIGRAASLKKRFSDHKNDLKRGNHRNSCLQRAHDKYGIEQFAFEIIEEISDSTILSEREKYWIKECKSFVRENGFNLTLGGEGALGTKLSAERRENLRKVNIGNKNAVGYKHTEDALKRMRELKIGKKFRLGCSPTEETRMKLRKALLNQKLSEQTKQKMSVSKTGSKSYQANFTDDQVKEIRFLFKYKGLKQSALVKMFKSDASSISKICLGKTYKNIIV